MQLKYWIFNFSQSRNTISKTFGILESYSMYSECDYEKIQALQACFVCASLSLPPVTTTK